MTTYPDKTTIRYSRGIDKFDNTPLKKTAVNFDAFEAAILADRSPKKGTTFFCGPLSYGPHDRPLKYPGEANYRLASHKSSRKFLATDFDGFSKPEVFDEVFKDLSAFRGFGYSTWSHSDVKPRARAVFLLDREVSRAEGIALGKSFGRMLEKIYGSESITLDKCVYQNEQPVYSPGPDALIFHFEGRAIEVDVMLAKYPEQNPQNIYASPNQCSPNMHLGKAGYARLTQESLHKVLGFIDCTCEPNWHDVSNALARAYGAVGRETFIAFSQGDFWGTPYPNFNLDETNEKFDRSLGELQSHPNGFGVRHLVEMAGLSLSDVEFEADTSAINTLNMVVTSNTGSSSVFTFPTVNHKGRPLQVSENLDSVLSAHNITARYNQIRKQCEVLIPGLLRLRIQKLVGLPIGSEQYAVIS